MMAYAFSLRQFLSGLSCVMLFAADVNAFLAHQSKQVNLQRSSLSAPMMMASDQQAEVAFMDWLGIENAPSVASTIADSPAGVMAAYWRSVSSTSKDTVLVAPSAGKEWTPEQVTTVNDLMETTCSSFDKIYHPHSDDADLQSPYLALRHGGSSACSMSSTSTESAVTLTPERNEIMEGIFTWFQNQLLNFESDEDFIDLGRKLLTIQEYVISDSTNKANLLADCWAEAAKLSVPGATVKANGEENSILIVASSLQDEDFVSFMTKQFSEPLHKLTAAGMGKGAKLNLYSWNAKDGLKYPMVLIYPDLEELEAPEDAKVMTFTELLQSCTEDEEEGDGGKQ
mmetsp:Transcript_7222/g.9531  ORF Transcript_7222/g.9531 Transcript_7222/m.9531 type:complete len:341 (+) Transcript_7222:135-1157(+)